MSWEGAITSFFKSALKIIIVGIGSELRSDDYAGVLIAKLMQDEITSSRLKIIEAESVPESYTRDIAEFAPTHVLFIDTAIMGLKPGSVRTFTPSEILGITMSSHKPEFSMMIEYLEQKIKAKYLFLGIEPRNLAIDGEMSNEVKAAIRKTARLLSNIVKNVIK